MVLPTRSEPHARSVSEPKSTPFWLLAWDFQPFAPPDALNTLVVDVPAFRPEQSRDPALAIAAILLGKTNDGLGQSLFISSYGLHMSLCRAGLAQYAASRALGHAKLLNGLDYTTATALRAYKFPFDAAAKIILSTVRSATAFLSRVFSCSSSFRRRAWSIFKPPYSRRHR